MYQNVGRLSERITKYRVQPIYPREFPIHWGIYELASSILLIGLSLIVVAGIAALVMLVIGIDSVSQLYGFNQTAGRFDVLFFLRPG